jgi:hypothetical protein
MTAGPRQEGSVGVVEVEVEVEVIIDLWVVGGRHHTPKR